MSLDPNTTASIQVTGVSLGCFNRHRKQWEVAFVAETRHGLMLKITKITDSGEVPFLRDTPIPRGSKISVTLRNASALPSPGGSHRADFGSIVDIDTQIHDNPILPFKRPDETITELVVAPVSSRNDLYAVDGMVSTFPVRLTKMGSTHPIKLFGYVATAAGADITYGRGGEVAIDVQGPGSPTVPPMPHAPGVRYSIWLDNRCPATPRPSHPDKRAFGRSAQAHDSQKLLADAQLISVVNHSDLVLVYHVLDHKGGDQFDLQNDDNDRGEGAICNFTDMSGRDSMFPLPS